ncbi:related to RGT2 - Sensor of high external glucose concentrations [Cephalotrichum gorgonifer]|uniref:Related to RGT2 - Sensor of high external glucose concentrations n=1 Tax=Cephalotrichum gorgonifer TaxID=2041049 RepID=A0AAE8STY1_9PEZI|nr:related to RGT2 - Sensor of high external glucose concentrations [Cephalotrichum gorgonifer]
MTSRGETPRVAQRFKAFTPMFAFTTFYMALAAFNFGFDVGNFAGVQAMQPFAKLFGQWNEEKELYALPPYLSSVMTATPFFGKLVGAIACGKIAERWGRRRALLCLACISLVGVTLQTSATTVAQFTVGRIVNFTMTGFCIVVVPIYQAECSPPELRGLVNSTIQMMIIFGQTIASLVNFGTQHILSDASWQIPVGLQFVVPVFLLAFLHLIPESPRWLLAQGRWDEAAKSLMRLRGRKEMESAIQDELDAFRFANANTSKGTWAEVFNRTNRRRTGIAILAMFGQQITGQAFISQYSTVFFQQNGFKDQAFLFTMLANVAGLVGTAGTWVVVDGFGRRPILSVGGFMMGTFLMIVAIISSVSNPSQAAKETMVASMILFNCMYCISWGPLSYVVLSESASARVKEKTSLVACCISILTTFVTSFTLPYLLNPPYAALGGKVGYIYGSICFASVVATILWIPELKGRSLEEVDRLFDMSLPAWGFNGIELDPEDIGSDAQQGLPTHKRKDHRNIG